MQLICIVKIGQHFWSLLELGGVSKQVSRIELYRIDCIYTEPCPQQCEFNFELAPVSCALPLWREQFVLK